MAASRALAADGVEGRLPGVQGAVGLADLDPRDVCGVDFFRVGGPAEKLVEVAPILLARDHVAPIGDDAANDRGEPPIVAGVSAILADIASRPTMASPTGMRRTPSIKRAMRYWSADGIGRVRVRWISSGSTSSA